MLCHIYTFSYSPLHRLALRFQRFRIRDIIIDVPLSIIGMGPRIVSLYFQAMTIFFAFPICHECKILATRRGS